MKCPERCHKNLVSFKPGWQRNFRDPSKNLVIKFQTAISPELFQSDKQFIARSKEDNQGFQFDF